MGYHDPDTQTRKIVPMGEPFSVARGALHGFADCIEVMGEHGEIAYIAKVGPGGPIHPRAAAEAKPWFYTGSPFGPEIIGLAWQRSAEHISLSAGAAVRLFGWAA